MIAQKERNTREGNVIFLVPSAKIVVREIFPGETTALDPGKDVGYWLGQWPAESALSQFDHLRLKMGLELPKYHPRRVDRLLNGYSATLLPQTETQARKILEEDPHALILLAGASYTFTPELRQLHRGLINIRPYQLDKYGEIMLDENGNPIETPKTEVWYIPGIDRSNILLGRSCEAGVVSLITRAKQDPHFDPGLPPAA